MSAFSAFLRKQQFNPSWVGIFVNPFFLARRALRVAIGDLAGQCAGRTVDVGCGRMPYRDLFPDRIYTGLEIDTPATREAGFADFFYDGLAFPFEDKAFDTAICNQVLEHVFQPETFLREIARILKPGGRLLLTVPFVWDEHEQPYDFARYSSFGLEALLERNGFRVLKQSKTLGSAAIIGQLTAAYGYKISWSRGNFARIVAMVLIIIPALLLGAIMGAILPKNPDLFLDNIILAERC